MDYDLIYTVGVFMTGIFLPVLIYKFFTKDTDNMTDWIWKS